jgi:spore coat protein U-like protein
MTARLIAQAAATPAVLALGLSLGMRSAQAQTAPNCSVTMGDVAFGSFQPINGGQISRTLTLTLSCTGGSPNSNFRMCLSLGSGEGFAAASPNRVMADNGSDVQYQMHQDSGRTILWGSDASTGSLPRLQWDFTTDAGGRTNATKRVYGRLLSTPNRDAVPGPYQASFAGAGATLAEWAAFSAGSCDTFSGTGRTTSWSFLVSASVAPQCTTTASTLNFGTRASLGTVVSATSNVNVSCSSSTAYSVGLNAGTGPGGSTALRRMSSGTGSAGYQLYRDAARTANWGETVGTDTASGIGSGSSQRFTVYGRIPAQATPPPGAYTDTVTVTVTY